MDELDSHEWNRPHLERLDLGQLVQRVRVLTELRDAFDAVLASRDGSDAVEVSLKEERRRLVGEINALVEVAGDVGARRAMRAIDADARDVFVGRGPGTVDMVFECSDGTLAVLENKGGTSRLGGRWEQRRRLRQGTFEYLRVTARQMAASSDSEAAVLGARLLAGLDAGTVRYGVARTTYARWSADIARTMRARYPNHELEAVDTEALTPRDRTVDFSEPFIEWVGP